MLKSLPVADLLRGAFLQIGCGVSIGIPVALAAGRLLVSQLHGVKVNDPLARGGATLLLFACSLMAGLIPARRATQVDPMEALRTEELHHLCFSNRYVGLIG